MFYSLVYHALVDMAELGRGDRILLRVDDTKLGQSLGRAFSQICKILRIRVDMKGDDNDYLAVFDCSETPAFVELVSRVQKGGLMCHVTLRESREDVNLPNATNVDFMCLSAEGFFNHYNGCKAVVEQVLMLHKDGKLDYRAADLNQKLL